MTPALAYLLEHDLFRKPASTFRDHALGSRGDETAGGIGDFDVDVERGDARAAIHPHLDVLAFDGDVLGDRGEDFLAQKGEQIRLAARGALVGQQDLKPLPRNRGRPPAAEQIEERHAALRPNSLSSKPLRSLGMVIGTSSPLSRRAASI